MCDVRWCGITRKTSSCSEGSGAVNEVVPNNTEDRAMIDTIRTEYGEHVVFVWPLDSGLALATGMAEMRVI